MPIVDLIALNGTLRRGVGLTDTWHAACSLHEGLSRLLPVTKAL
jgi:hypothetical protein